MDRDITEGGCGHEETGQGRTSQRWKKMVTLVTPSVLIFSSCANFLVLHETFCTSLRILRIFAQLCCVFVHFCENLQKFCTFLHSFLRIFARLCIFLQVLFVLIFQAKKWCLLFFTLFPTLPISWLALQFIPGLGKELPRLGFM